MGVITISNVTKRYGKKAVLDGISSQILDGQVVALLGRNGSGKTTLMRILYGLIEPDRGETSVLGNNSRTNYVELRKQTALVQEECHLYPWMSAETLAGFLSPLYPAWDEKLFSQTLIDLEVPLEKPVKFLSRGTRKKLMLSLALAAQPTVLLLDEPLSGLDPVVREQILSTLIRTLSSQGKTFFLTSHEINEIERVCDRVLILSQGKLILDLGLDQAKTKIQRILATLQTPVEVLPQHPSIISACARGAELDIIVQDFSAELMASILSNFMVKESRVEGLSIEEMFRHLTSKKEEER
ncbi:ABC transporter ATP-binding protein [bacterium]|nr:ABC transporter ATP-binding protein [bacterium]